MLKRCEVIRKYTKDIIFLKNVTNHNIGKQAIAAIFVNELLQIILIDKPHVLQCIEISNRPSSLLSKLFGKLRYKNYIDTLRKPLLKLFDIVILPPTRPAAIQNIIYRTNHQVQEWLGVALPPTEWG
jgi:hypothetical protein